MYLLYCRSLGQNFNADSVGYIINVLVVPHSFWRFQRIICFFAHSGCQNSPPPCISQLVSVPSCQDYPHPLAHGSLPSYSKPETVGWFPLMFESFLFLIPCLLFDSIQGGNILQFLCGQTGITWIIQDNHHISRSLILITSVESFLPCMII